MATAGVRANRKILAVILSVEAVKLLAAFG